MWLDRALGVTRSLSRVGAWIAGGLLLAAAVLIGVEVLARKLFAWSTGGSTEISSYVLAVATTWSLSFALLEKAHIRIDVVTQRLAHKSQALLELLAMLMMAAFVFPLTYFGYRMLQTSFIRHSTANTPLSTPLWIPQGLWVVGLVFLSFVVVLLIAKVFVLLVQRKYADIVALTAPESIDVGSAGDGSDAGRAGPEIGTGVGGASR